MELMLANGGDEDAIVDLLESASDEDEGADAQKEPSSRRLNRIKAVTKRLLFSKEVTAGVEKKDVMDCWRGDEQLEEKEIDAVLTITNSLRPYLGASNSSKSHIIADGMNFVVLGQLDIRHSPEKYARRSTRPTYILSSWMPWRFTKCLGPMTPNLCFTMGTSNQ